MSLFKTRQSNFLVNLFIVYELDRWSQDPNADFTLKYYLIGGVKLPKNVDPDKYFGLALVFALIVVQFFHFQILIEVKMLF